MIPNIKKHNPNPKYLRGLIDETGLPQRAIARQLGVSERIFRQYITHTDNQSYIECPYPVQFSLERLSIYQNMVALITFDIPDKDDGRVFSFLNEMDKVYHDWFKGASVDVIDYSISGGDFTIYFAVHRSYSKNEFEKLFCELVKTIPSSKHILDKDIVLRLN